MSISQVANLKNPFIINKLTINNMDVTPHFIEMKIEEDIFSPFIKGNIKLSKLILNHPQSWNESQLGFLNKNIEIEWNTDIIKNKKTYTKKLSFIVYSIAEETESYIKLSFIQKDYLNYLTKQFCDGWEDENVINIIKNIFENYVFGNIKPDFNFGSSNDKISFTNPNWTPIKAIKFLLPMISDNYFLFMNTNGKLNCKSINDFLSSDKIEDIKLITTKDDLEKNLSEVIEFEYNKKSNNIIEQLYNNIHGIKIVEYNVLTKELITTNINNNIKNIKQLGSENNIVTGYDGTSIRYDFSLSNINKINSETSISVHDFFKNNNLVLFMFGSTNRNIGDIINIDLSIKNRYLLEQRDEIRGKNLISSIVHMFTKTNYIQKISLVKPGLNHYHEKQSI